MLENSLFKDEKSRKCESNKKISYKQLSPISTSKAVDSSIIYSGNTCMTINHGDVLESAKFKRIVRDCKGNPILESNLLRLRTVGSNDWVSFDETDGLKILESLFIPATDLDAINFVKREVKSGDLKTVDSKVTKTESKKYLKPILTGLAVVSIGIILLNKLSK
jgi:hypothetical protein